jgi:iron complex outermembrane receptor protein
MRPNSSGRSFHIAVVVVLVAALASTAWAAQSPAAAAHGPQSSSPPQPGTASGRVLGILQDQSGAVLRGARIEIRNGASSVVRDTVSDAQGRYLFESIPPGRYRVAALAHGFAAAVRDDLAVEAGRDSIVDLVLEVARQEALVEVTAPSTASPFTVETDPKAPRQPIPAHDGADYLKTIPGFSIVRKGGTDGDPVLRGMAGSRLGVLLDGQQILGGCGGRMDPPTAYVFPAAYDRITVLKGPQTVLYGAGMSAGAVLFERQVARAATPAVAMSSALTLGAFGRHDEMADVRAATPSFYVQGSGTRSHTDDYRDGNGESVHSLYTRWSVNAAFGWTPNRDTRLELSAAQSNGQAAYADRTMDGSLFARDNVALTFDRRFASSFVQRIEVESYYNYIDHVMDNYTLRTPGMMYSAMNPDRTTVGGRGVVTMQMKASTSVVAGVDAQHNVHTGRSVMGATSAEAANAAYTSAPRVEDMRFTQIGLFGEATHALTPRSRLVGGLRVDWHEALDSRACVNTMMCMGSSPLKNSTRGAADRETLPSAFARYEHDLGGAGLSGRFSAGVGHVGRSPDYWERSKQDPVTLNSVFLSAKTEQTTQLDAGVVWSGGAWSGSVSAFASRIHDYLLIRWQPTPTLTRNVDARTLGTEASVAYAVNRHLKADATVAFIHADNTTDGKPLAQQPPTDGRLGLTYDNQAFSIGVLARLVAPQNRVDVGSGNIVNNGQDLGPTAGFSVFSVNGGYRLKRVLQITGGVDNLLDRTYAEHISQAGAMVPGYIQTTRVNEPGRTIWVKVNFEVR